jgi:hypothetical protein
MANALQGFFKVFLLVSHSYNDGKGWGIIHHRLSAYLFNLFKADKQIKVKR